MAYGKTQLEAIYRLALKRHLREENIKYRKNSPTKKLEDLVTKKRG